jgi:hypothetical protein
VLTGEAAGFMVIYVGVAEDTIGSRRLGGGIRIASMRRNVLWENNLSTAIGNSD